MQADKCIDRTVQERRKKIRSDHITVACERQGDLILLILIDCLLQE